MRCEKCRGVGVLDFFELPEEAQSRAVMGWVFCCDMCRGMGSVGVAFIGKTPKDPATRDRLSAAQKRKYDVDALPYVTSSGNPEEEGKDD